MRKAFHTIALTLLIAVFSLLAVGVVFHRTAADANPNDLLARTLMPYLRDGRTFRLADVYPDAWDSVQIVRSDESLTDWEWRTLRAYQNNLLQLEQQEQLLIFWRDGGIANAIRFNSADNGMPWFVPPDPEDSMILSRESAIFRATLVREAGAVYYACEPIASSDAEVQI